MAPEQSRTGLRSGLLTAALVVLIGLGAHVTTGFVPYPMGDDFAYGPLTWLALHPEAYPRDEHLRLFADHAELYNAVYRLSLATVGVAAGFLIATMTLAVLMVAVMYWVLRVLIPEASPERRLGALLVALGLSVLAAKAGIGRGDFGGFLSEFFHHQLISLVLALAALAAALGGRGVLAGLCLGLAAYAQPATALHAALAVGMGFLAIGAKGLRPLALSIVVSAVVALPAVLRLARSVLSGSAPDIPAEIVIEEGYRFRAPHHYDLPIADYLLFAGYVVLGLLAAVVIGRQRPGIGRAALGQMAGAGALLALSFAVYGLGYLQWPVLFIIDANRSSPLFFVLASLLAAAAVQASLQRGAFRSEPLALAVAAVGLTLVAANYSGWALPALGSGLVLALALVPRGRGPALLAIAAALYAAIGLSQRELRYDFSQSTFEALTWIRDHTPESALFIIPVGLIEFRELSRRSAYVDFKTTSMAQPEHVMLTRRRMEEVAQPGPADLKLRGYPAVERWEADQHAAATCTGMTALMDRVGAEYTVLRSQDRRGEPQSIPDCGAAPALLYRNGALAVFGQGR